MPNGRKVKALEQVAVIVLFLGWLWLPLAGQALGLSTASTIVEKRNPAPFPDTWKPSEFPRKFERYYNDHFGFRNTFIRWHHFLMAKSHASIVSKDSQVVIGKDGWLYYTKDLTCCRPLAPYTPAELERAKSVLEARKEYLGRRGIRYLYVIVPIKPTIYPEFLPDGYAHAAHPSRRRQLAAYLRDHSLVDVLDLTEALTEAKRKGLIYLRTDTHWNDYGAYFGYVGILRRLSAELEAAPLSDFEIVETDSPGGDMAESLGLADYFRETEHRSLRRKSRPAQPSTRRPKAVMIQDSFAQRLKPFLERHFDPILYAGAFDRRYLDARPDVVIEETSERAFVGFPFEPW